MSIKTKKILMCISGFIFVVLLAILIFLLIPLNKDSSHRDVQFTTCENGHIELHENLVWMPNYWPTEQENATHEDYFEAVSNEGYYFEKWLFLDKNLKELDIGESATLRDYNTPFISKNILVSQYSSQYPDWGKLAFVKAIFTNDESKLEDVVEPSFELVTTNPEVGKITYQTNTLPDKKVKGTLLWKYIILDNQKFRITKINKILEERYIDGVLTQDVIGIINDDNYYSKGCYCFNDVDYVESFYQYVTAYSIEVDFIEENKE